MAGHLELDWAGGGALSVRGSGFAPHEQLVFTLTIASGGSSVVSSPGNVMQSSGNSLQQSSSSLQADAQGAFRWSGTVIASGDAQITVTVQGGRSGRTDARISGARRH